MKYLFLIICLTLLFACESEDQVDRKLPDGNYSGTFQRQHVWAESDTANITITINSNEWSGTSDIEKYPALCNGTYLIIGDTIIFENECVWTADFDWSLILDGKYILKETGNLIEFSYDDRSATSDTYIDIYKLERQE